MKKVPRDQSFSLQSFLMKLKDSDFFKFIYYLLELIVGTINVLFTKIINYLLLNKIKLMS